MKELIAKLGPVIQVAFVPENICAALRHWTEDMGVGPFFELANVPYESLQYNGQASNLDLTVYIAFWGDIQIELVQQNCTSASVYRDWVDTGGRGVHHFCIMVDDLTRAQAALADTSAKVMSEIRFGPEARALFVSFVGTDTLLEIFQPSPEQLQFAGMMRQAAREWNGEDPIRRPC